MAGAAALALVLLVWFAVIVVVAGPSLRGMLPPASQLAPLVVLGVPSWVVRVP